jgi:hypothetical protein
MEGICTQEHLIRTTWFVLLNHIPDVDKPKLAQAQNLRTLGKQYYVGGIHSHGCVRQIMLRVLRSMGLRNIRVIYVDLTYSNRMAVTRRVSWETVVQT